MQSSLIERALEMAKKRRRILEDMCQAIQVGDKDRVFALAKELTGIGDEEKRNPTHPRLN
jgi:hypothetical protein